MAEEEVEPSVPAFSGHRFYRQWGRTGRRWPVFALTPEYVSYLKTLPPVAYIDAMEEADHFIRYKNRKAGFFRCKNSAICKMHRFLRKHMCFLQNLSQIFPFRLHRI